MAKRTSSRRSNRLDAHRRHRPSLARASTLSAPNAAAMTGMKIGPPMNRDASTPGATTASAEDQSRSNQRDLANGTRHTPFRCSMKRATHGVGFEYGGFIHTRPDQGEVSPSSAFV